MSAPGNPVNTSSTSHSRGSFGRIALPAAVLGTLATSLTPLAFASQAQAASTQPGSLGTTHVSSSSSLTSAARPLSTLALPNAGTLSNPGRVPTTIRSTTVVTPATYTVRSGDSVWAIAQRFKVSVADIARSNNLRNVALIHPGQVLKLTAAAATSQGSSSGQASTSTPQPAPSRATQGNSSSTNTSGGSYTIVPGDTLTSIAAKQGTTVQALQSINRLAPGAMIYAGKKLTIPGASSAQTSSQPATHPQKPQAQKPQSPKPQAPLVPSTFGSYTYPQATVGAANANKAALNAAPVPSRTEMRTIIANTARSMGVDPSLALAFAWQESGFDARAVSPANAIGAMQVIPQSGEWASSLVGRKLNLLNPHDNAVAGVSIIRALVRTSKDLDTAIAGYYQGQYSVSRYGMFKDTKAYVANVRALQARFR